MKNKKRFIPLPQGSRGEKETRLRGPGFRSIHDLFYGKINIYLLGKPKEYATKKQHHWEPLALRHQKSHGFRLLGRTTSLVPPCQKENTFMQSVGQSRRMQTLVTYPLNLLASKRNWFERSRCTSNLQKSLNSRWICSSFTPGHPRTFTIRSGGSLAGSSAPEKF